MIIVEVFMVVIIAVVEWVGMSGKPLLIRHYMPHALHLIFLALSTLL